MQRTLLWAGVGWASGLLILAGLGFWAGCKYGGHWVARPHLPPGLGAACAGVFTYLAFSWWLFGSVGAVFGAACGFGSWLVRPMGLMGSRRAGLGDGGVEPPGGRGRGRAPADPDRGPSR